MATKQEWVEYFELVNGKKPSMADFQEAKANHEFEDETSTESQTAEPEMKDSEKNEEVTSDTPVQSHTTTPEGQTSEKSSFTDYYKELDFTADLAISAIQEVLDSKLKEARTRIQKMPEINKKIISWVNEAKTIFTTDESKAKYDAELAESKKIPEVTVKVDERVEKFNEWLDKARDYYYDNQYDLASTAMDEVRKYRTNENETDSLILAGWIYNDSHQYREALQQVNKALILNPNFPYLYKQKYVAMWNIEHNNDNENKDKATAYSKGNELTTLLDKYISTAKAWEFTSIEVVNEAEDYSAGELFWLLSNWQHANSKFYSDELLSNVNSLKGLQLAQEHNGMSTSGTVIRGYGYAQDKKKAYETMETAKKSIFMIQHWMLYVLGALVLIGLVTISQGFGIVLLIIGGGGIAGLFAYQNSTKTGYQNAKKIYDDLWSKKLLPTYNEWKRLSGFN